MTSNLKVKSEKLNVGLGFSLIEILVVISLFAAVGVMTSQILLTSLKNSRKAEAGVRVRTNLEHALSIMERQIRGAGQITSCSSTRLDYADGQGISAYFRCIDVGGIGYVASGSARLTNSAIDVDCSQVFVCTPPPPDTNTVDIKLDGRDTTATGVEGARVTIQTKILLRN